MTTETVKEEDQRSTDHAAETAAFEASFEGTSAPETTAKASTADAPEAQAEPEKAPAAPTPDDSQEAATTAASPPAAEAAPTAPSPKAEDPDLKSEVRKLHGRIGALNDQLQQALKAKETEGKPAVLSTVQLTRLKEQYPEMADILEGDIADVIAAVAHKSADPKEIQALVSKQVAEQVFVMRQEAITDRHENWMTDCWADQIGGTRTHEYAAWLKTMTPEEADAFENSQNPGFVSRKLDQFYDWKGKAAKAETEKQSRLKAAITPQGTARAGPQTMSEDEAERKAFEDAYNQ